MEAGRGYHALGVSHYAKPLHYAIELLQTPNILTTVLLLDNANWHFFALVKSVTEKAQPSLAECSEQGGPTASACRCLTDAIVACPTPIISRDVVNVLDSSGNDLRSVVGNTVGSAITGLILNNFCCHWVTVFL